MTITSRLNILNSIIAPVLLIFWLGAIASFLIFLSFEDVNNGKVDSIFKTPIYGSLILFAVIIGTSIHYIKMSKSIQIDSKGIKVSNLFNKEFISWSEIKMIELIGKSQIANSPLDATILKLKNGRKIDLIASRYENMPTIRKTLQQVIECIDAKKPIELNPILETSKVDPIGFVNLSGMTKYSGNHILSFNGLVIYGLNAFTIFMVINSPNHFGLLFLVWIVIFGFTYGFLGSQLHYFHLDNNYLVVKNHVWPWVNDKYRVDNIKQVSIETPYKRSTSLMVITKDFKSNLYQGGSLRNSTWKDLLNNFQNLNVDIGNEAID
ncbi:hypothetical protein [Algoriphagus aquimarinus]|uniref:Uncharacterized protein n=1 Tax=Algoriphagus aquimarinus TaxID=237018 RepID=A0A5C7AXI9_9BACT|nr:hypothetical protein [Algoriphagus aquimarinus]TXE11245.1 hypothetical protein ESV85_11915 [Algoriphagus aquimarinus]